MCGQSRCRTGRKVGNLTYAKALSTFEGIDKPQNRTLVIRQNVGFGKECLFIKTKTIDLPNSDSEQKLSLRPGVGI